MHMRRLLSLTGLLSIVLLGLPLLEAPAQIVQTGTGIRAKTLTDELVTDLVTVTVPNSHACHLHFIFSAHAANATEAQEHTGLISFVAAATNLGVVNASSNDNDETIANTAGTLTDAWSNTTAANSATLRVAFNSSLDVATELHLFLLHPTECSFTFN